MKDLDVELAFARQTSMTRLVVPTWYGGFESYSRNDLTTLGQRRPEKIVKKAAKIVAKEKARKVKLDLNNFKL